MDISYDFSSMNVTIYSDLSGNNQFGNTTTEQSKMISIDADYTESAEFKIIKYTIYLIILVLSVTGNTMVICIICAARRLRLHSNALIINLAICDIAVPMLSIPFDLPLEENNYIWFYGRFVCHILWPVTTLFSTSAALTLAAISLDRYRQLLHPFKAKFSRKQIKYIIVIVHIISMVSMIPYFLALKLDSATNECQEYWHLFIYRQLYTLYLFVIQYGIPLPFMIIVYILAGLHLYRSNERIKSSMRMTVLLRDTQIHRSKSRRESIGDIIRESFTFKRKQETKVTMRMNFIKRRQHTTQAIKMFLVVVTVFALCNFPNQVVWLWSDFGEGWKYEHFMKIMIVCRMFTYTNSVFNPIIYGSLNRDFYKGFKKILKCQCRNFNHDNVSSPVRTESIGRSFLDGFRERTKSISRRRSTISEAHSADFLKKLQEDYEPFDSPSSIKSCDSIGDEKVKLTPHLDAEEGQNSILKSPSPQGATGETPRRKKKSVCFDLAKDGLSVHYKATKNKEILDDFDENVFTKYIEKLTETSC